MQKPEVSIIISTYNQPKWLQKVLWSYEVQTFKDFELVIADDGSKEETRHIISDFSNKTDISVKHVWQEDHGFQKTKILNKAITEVSSDYIIFTDGDCIAKNDFVETHIKLRKKNFALSGGYFKLTESISKTISKQDIINQNCFKVEWLLSNGQPKSFKMNKLTFNKKKAKFLNTFTTTKATFDGMNVSAWKHDILDVNGFDERMQYGGEDREIGERLMNKGVRFKQIRYSAICVHLYHERPYKNDLATSKNKAIRKDTKSQKVVETKFGIKKL